MIARLARAAAALSGWRRWAAAAVLGAVAALALPPIYALPALAVAFTGLVWILDGIGPGPRGLRQALAAGWWFGFAHFCAGLYWITNALLVDAASYGWLAPFAVSGLSVYFALFPALAVAAAWAAPRGTARVLMLAAAWTTAEVLRGALLTGFPWNLMGTVFAFSPASMQGAALVGAYGLGFLAVAVAAAPATLAYGGAAGRPAWRPTAAAFLVLALVAGGGYLRLALAPAAGSADTAVRLRIVQPNIAQRDKWQRRLARGHYETLLRLTRAPAPPPDLVIWPETALPFVMTGDPRSVAALAAAAPADGHLITGMVRGTPAGVEPRRVWNSVIAVTPRGGIAAAYDKHHLVPFGEYVPLRAFVPFPKLTAGRVDFSAGPGPRTVALPGIPAFSPLVCYEAIFPHGVVSAARRPAWMLNVTNDAWFGASNGPHQHLAAARLRAVEQGLPMVRAANTGISAVIDPWGRVIARLGLGRQGAIEAALPRPLGTPTPFARLGVLATALTLALGFGLAALAARHAGAGPARS